MPREKVTFEPNVATVIQLEGEPRQSDGIRGPQMQYFLADEKIMWVDLDLAKLIAASGAASGDSLEITKQMRKANGKQIVTWEVIHLCDEPAEEPTPPPARSRSAARPAGHSNGHAALAARPAEAGVRAPATQETGNLCAALMIAIDAAREAEAYAGRQGMQLEFGAEDIRAMAATVYIQAHRLIEAGRN